MNSSGFLKNVFSITPANNQDPYLYNAQITLGHSKSIRIGSYFDLDSRNSKNQNTADLRDITGGVRLGWQKDQFVYRKFYFCYGLDAICNYRSSFSYFKGISLRKATLLYGGGPVVGFGYKISDRFNIFTESSYYFSTGSRTKTLKTDTGTDIDSERIWRLKFLAPNSFYVAFRF